jgi:undecaprenyl-diphosphatase
MSDWIAVVMLGIIEGITEFLPVSSTGHLLVAEKLFQACRWLDPQHWLVVKSTGKDLFNVVIQSGAVLAVLPLFPQRLRQFTFQWREKATQIYALKIVLACVLTGIPGFILEKEGFKLPEQLWPIAWALLIGGIGFVAVEAWLRGRSLNNEVTWAMAVAVGVGQLIAAVFPGASRSGSTILLCLLLGLARPAATEFCFLVGIPTMLAASGLKILHAFHHHAGETGQEHWGMVGVGFIVAAVVSFVVVRWLLRYVQTHTFTLFGWYRIALALVILLLLEAHHRTPALLSFCGYQ